MQREGETTLFGKGSYIFSGEAKILFPLPPEPNHMPWNAGIESYHWLEATSEIPIDFHHFLTQGRRYAMG
jgi:hypothetical protein